MREQIARLKRFLREETNIFVVLYVILGLLLVAIRLSDGDFSGAVVTGGILIGLLVLVHVLRPEGIGNVFRAGEIIDEGGKTFTEQRTMQDYQHRYPSSFDANGRFRECHECGANSIFMKERGFTSYGTHHSHLCRQCGTELWRSTL